MLDDLRIGLDTGLGVPAGLQIESKLLNDYAEMARGHPLTDKATAKYFFNHSASKEPRRFSRCRHTSSTSTALKVEVRNCQKRIAVRSNATELRITETST